MKLEEIVEGLAPSEKSAIATLESFGWAVMFDCKIEDGRYPDGSRKRTFQRSRGRHELVLMLRSTQGRPLPDEPEPVVEMPVSAPPAVLDPQPVVSVSELPMKFESEPTPPATEPEPEPYHKVPLPEPEQDHSGKRGKKNK